MIYRFNGCVLDTDSLELRRDGELQAVEPQVFAVLVCLIENRERVVTKDDLVEAVWGGRIVSDANLSSRINGARRAVGDSGKRQHVIKTLHSRGFRFVGVLETDEGQPDAHTANSIDAGADSPAQTASVPSVAVLPFSNLSGEESGNYFAEGIAEDITTELSRFGSLFVISRLTSFGYRDSPSSERQIGGELGVDYVLTGSVRRSDDKVRVGVALTEVQTGKQVWAERFDRATTAIFEVQDEISETVASTMVGRLLKVGTARAQAKRSESLTAYEHLLKGLDLHKSGVVTPERARQAFEAFSRATEEDAGFARAHAWRACSYSRTWSIPASAEEIRQCLDYITTALELDPDEAESHRIAGALYRFMREYEKADFHVDRSLELNPNDAHIAIKAAEHECYMDRPDRARELARRAMRLNPHFPDWYWEDAALAEYVSRNPAAAIENFRKAQSPTHAGLAFWSAAAQQAGDHKSAAGLVERMRQSYPDISLSVFRDGAQYNCFRNRQVFERFIQDLSTAGLE